MTELLDLVVDRRILFNIGVRVGDIGLRLVVVVVGDKILHSVVREKFPELAAKLRGQRLVVRQNKRRAVDVCDDVCHRERFARACDAQQGLFLPARQHAFGQLFNCLRLVPRRFVGGDQLKFSFFHIPPPLWAVRSID